MGARLDRATRGGFRLNDPVRLGLEQSAEQATNARIVLNDED